MLKKLLIPIAVLATITGFSTSYVAGANIIPAAKTAVHEEAIPMVNSTPKVTPKSTPTPTVTPTPLTTVLPSEKYSYKGEGDPGLLSVMIKTNKDFTTYASEATALRKVNKCVVSFYAQAVNGDYTADQQQVTSDKLIQQYASTLKLKGVSVKQGSLLSDESYGTGNINYKVDAAYSAFTAKAVHGVAYARMFGSGLGFIMSVSCPTKTDIPALNSIIRVKTDDGVVQPAKYYPDDHRSAF